MDPDGKRIVVTGASRGIGAAIARELASAGARLVLVARSAERLAELADQLEAEFIVGDLLDRSFASDVIDRVAAGGPVDILVNNAGIEHTGPLWSQSADDIRSVFELNLVIPAQLCAGVIPLMQSQGTGHLVNVSSLAMCATTPGFATYGASKSGLSALAETLRVELDGTGIGLTTVEIGFVDTAMFDDLRAVGQTGSVIDRYRRLRLQRVLDVEEVAVAVRRGIEDERHHVRLPRRSAVFPMITNAPRAVGRLVQRGVPTR